MKNDFYTVYIYTNNDRETIIGTSLPYPCDPRSISLVVEYHGHGNIINLYNPNDR